METKRAALLALVLLAACDGNPIGPGGGDDTGGGGGGDGQDEVPAAIAVNLKAISYNRATDTLEITLDGVDASPVEATFDRAVALDIDGYDAYVYQEDGLNRAHLAFVAESGRGNLQAAAVADGGQFGYHFGGGHFLRIDTYTQPTTGLFSYTGTYAGVFVPGDGTTPALPPTLEPARPYRVRGDILVNASFADSRVNGGVTNRVVLADNGAVLLNLESLNLVPTAIDEDGRFLGDTELAGDVPGATDPSDAVQNGKYGGLFGGTEATDVAGALVINPVRGEADIWEYGVFNLPRCGTAGEGPLCALQ